MKEKQRDSSYYNNNNNYQQLQLQRNQQHQQSNAHDDFTFTEYLDQEWKTQQQQNQQPQWHDKQIQIISQHLEQLTSEQMQELREFDQDKMQQYLVEHNLLIQQE